MIGYRLTIETLKDIKATTLQDVNDALMARIRCVEVPLAALHYPIRTCRWQNRKKFRRQIIKALSSGSLGQFTGVQVYRRD